MADFKDVIIRLQENRNSNVEAIETQTAELSNTFIATAKSQNRSFGQSLSLQQKRTNEELKNVVGGVTGLGEFFEAQQDSQQAMAEELKRNAAMAGGEGAAAADAVTEAANKSDKKTRGLFGGLMSGLGGMVGGVGLGGGALLAGAGILLGGGALLLDKLMDLDGKKVKDNVIELVSIKDEFDGLGDFFLTGGAFLGAMTGIGIGLAALSVGAGAAAAVEYFAGDIEWAKSVKTNVKELLSINDMAGGSFEFLAKGGAFGIAMTAIGTGLAVFGAGSAVAGMSDQLLTTFGTKDWAQSIVDNVVTLLSINEAAGTGLIGLVGEGAAFLLAMTGIGAGLAIFGVGAGVAGLGLGLANFTDPEWAKSIKKSVVTLLSIDKAIGEDSSLIGESGKFALSMLGISYGLAVFGVAAGVAGLGMGLANFTDPEWAQGIVDNVTTLLSISSLPGLLLDTGVFLTAMTGISAGIIAFSAAEGFAAAIGYFSGGDTVDNIKKNVQTAMSILEDENISQEKATELKTTLTTVGEALSSFAGGNLGASLKNLGASIFDFLAGKESPVKEMLSLAENDEELLNASIALTKLSSALGVISQLKFDGKNINMKEFAEDLAESVPVIESAIMGGTIEKFGLFNDIDFKGLASPDIKFAEATENILALRSALGENIEFNPPALANTSAELGDNINGMTGNSQPIIISNDQSSQIVNNSSSKASIVTAKNTNPPDTTIQAITPIRSIFSVY